MFITKKHIPRRAVLKAAGVTLGLPFLDAMVPAGTALAQTAAVPKLRTGFFYIPHGAIMGNTSHGPALDKWTPSGSGADFKLSPILASLEPYKKYVSSFGELGECRHGGFGSFVYSRHMAQRHPSGYRRSPRAYGHDSRSGDRENHRPGDALCPRSKSPLKPPSSRRRVAADTIPRCLSATRNRRCRWSRIRGRSFCSCSVRATRRRSARQSANARTACWI